MGSAKVNDKLLAHPVSVCERERVQSGAEPRTITHLFKESINSAWQRIITLQRSITQRKHCFLKIRGIVI